MPGLGAVPFGDSGDDHGLGDGVELLDLGDVVEDAGEFVAGVEHGFHLLLLSLGAGFGGGGEVLLVEVPHGGVDGVANRVDRLKAIGNGQVPLCAATAWRILSERN